MAFIQVNMLSDCLMRTVQVNVLLPVDKLGVTAEKGKKYKTLYLLHGVLGSQIDWVNNTRLQRYAEEKNLAIVMPAGDNAFYVDEPLGKNNYGEFVGRELVEMTRRMFPLSEKREDTFIGGFSMGGYGAMRNGLKYSETFGAIVELSGAVSVEGYDSYPSDTENWLKGREFFEAKFGDLSKLKDSDKNPKWLIEQLQKQKKSIPDIFMACGDEDELLAMNNELNQFLTKKKVKHFYEVGKGNHDWDFWDAYIKKAIYEWLPLEASEQGIHSGNISKK